ncbi:MAG: hypothetical protein VX944_05960 [Myxococcota bacterium]|nr:hypothetical protein [Myxococcota bacterium]
MRPLVPILMTALLAVGCGGEEPPAAPAATVAVVDPVLAADTWPARMAHDDQRSRFEQHDGWRQVFDHELSGALASFAAGGDQRGLARVHQALADLYASAALLTANATVEAYGTDAQPSDPAHMAYFVGVSHMIRGDHEEGKALLKVVDGVDALVMRAQAWMSLTADDASLSDLEGITGPLGDVQPGTEPPVASLPHFELTERTEKANRLGVNDPTALLARAAWHRAAAAAAAPETDQGLQGQMARRYAIGASAAQTHPVLAVDDAWLFAGSTLSAADAAFVAEAAASGVESINAWSGRSVLAAALSSAVVEGKLDPQLAQDAGFGLAKQLSALMADVGGGVMGFHRPFTQRARIAVLQAGMIAADANDQYRDAGILRLNALERMESIGIDPVFALAVAAWDAGNRNPLRAEEILHQFRASYPALSIAKPALEALHLRRSRNAGPANPVH